MGTKAYDFLAGSEGIESSYFLTKSKALEAFPMLKRSNVVGALVYYGRQFFRYDSTSSADGLQMGRTMTQE